jgi:alkanesulfonate monooxygenase SsuD/methylene tetrahydromethanopterin reductase-like flavin-dependent oxidoreductase (luciferase family)
MPADATEVEFGAHLPLTAYGRTPPSAQQVAEYARRAEELGFTAVCANDHILFRRPWLDGPAALSIAAASTSRVQLATTVLVPALRHPVVAAKWLGTLDVLSGGRLLVGVGPGSYAPDFEACGLPFDERFRLLEEAIDVLRGYWQDESMAPGPLRPLGPPVWVASWGSPPGLRRVARLGDGWLASAYNTTPEKFSADHAFLRGELASRGRDADGFPNALASTFSYLTSSDGEAERVARSTIGPALGRPPEELLERLLIGTHEACAEKLRRLGAAGVQRVFVWPAIDPIGQLERFAEQVVPLVE